MIESLVSASLNDAKPKTGTNQIYNLAPADYYVNASSGCGWSFTFRP